MDHFDDLRQTLGHARACYELWWFLIGHHDRRMHVVSVFNRYLSLYETVRPALFSTFVVRLASVYGTRTDEISFQRIPEAALIPGYVQLWERGRKFYKYRSKIIAHRDINIATDNFVAESGCSTYNDMWALLDETCNLFEAIAVKLKVPGLFIPDVRADIIKLVEDLDHYHRTHT